MKFIVALAFLLGVVYAQRPWYAGSQPIGYPGLAARFRDDSEDSSVTSTVANRFDGPTPYIPVDARGDVNLINRINQWPRENQPFWVLNAEHIEAQRNPRV